MNLLSVSHLGKAYRVYASEFQRIGRWFGLPIKPSEEHWVMKDVSFSIRPGESIGIVGQNGAGKSTLLKMITGTLQPSEGSVQVNGRIAAILELGMGFTPELTGRQNVFHSAGLMGFSVAQIAEAMPEIEAFAEIGEYFDEPVRTYSSGMQMRVAFAVSTAFRPDLLIVDEALSVGDSYFQAKCFKRIKQYREEGMTLILVSHSADDIVRHCERAILLKNGRVAFDGPSREVTNRYLDELFGKKKGAGHETEVASPGLVSEDFLNTNDVFATRAGYNPAEYRWGHGGAAILDYLVIVDGERFPSRIESNSNGDFYFKVRFDADFESVVPGFLIKTLDGVFLYGTNSFVSSRGQSAISVRAGDIRMFRFSLPLNLNAGDHLVSFGISSGNPLMGDLLPLDRRYDSVMLKISRVVQFWGLSDMQATFNIEYQDPSEAEVVAHD
ncbi:ABC transporter ATP-binding protein [Pseudomonas sp. 1912-s]|uniref:ABC transporter ATP-binding protein n=1 Tax=Pseudomonas sp. 1912-s TaxID=3033802 RepID=UPI0023DEFC14|nr:ABC transporter ATP-binding protein [Pseudomonas sp. 1912-s]MDF3197106.1 ABC transporter ATP-binding protein [Pseudomonas sp. 1912-s]